MGSIDFLLHQAGWFKEFSVSWFTKTNLVELLTGKTNDWFVGPTVKKALGHIPEFFKAILALDTASSQGLGSTSR